VGRRTAQATKRRRDVRRFLDAICECEDEHCCQAVRLTAPEYDQARAAPEWLALVADHRATTDRAKVVVPSAGMAPSSD
jgi:hypothetical protein